MAAILTVLAVSVAPTAPPADATVPGQPGTTQAGTAVYSETFSNQAPTSKNPPITIVGYTGSAGTTGADSETYTESTAYTPAGGQCDGWILNSTSTQPTSTQDSGCANNEPSAWQTLQAMADDLGLFQGQSSTQAAANQALSEFTNSVANNDAVAAGYQLQTTSTISATAGHFYAVSADFAEANCTNAKAAQASERIDLIEDGTSHTLNSGLDPCTASGVKQYTGTSATGVIYVAPLLSAAAQLPTTGTPTLGFDLYDAQTTGAGNDVEFDLPQIIDVTPQLDKAFSPTSIGQGQTSTLTYTITNTSELDAKNGWGFTDNLPAGLTATGVNSTTCTAATITAAAGATKVTTAGGDLGAGQSSCTVSVQVTASAAGSYTNGPSNFPTSGGLTGLNAPGSATLTVTPTVNLSITKVANAASYNPSAPITYTITVKNAGPSTATDAAVTDPIPALVTGATWTCTATSGSSCAAASGSGNISTTATIAASGTVTYTVTGTVASTATAGTTISNTATVVPPAGTSDANCPPSPGAGCSSSATATTNQAVEVNKTWVVTSSSGTALGTYNVPSQSIDTASTVPTGFASAPTLTGQTSPVFGTAYEGYAPGQSLTVGEGAVTVPSGCTLSSQKVTSVNGAALATASALPYTATVTATPAPNTVTITNTVTCAQTLTLVKKVAYGSLPATDWTLTATGPAAALTGPNGVTGSAAATASVSPNAAYALKESSTAAGAQNYAPTSAGWVCVAASNSVPVSASAVVVGYGQAVTCTITNTTASVTVLKHIEDPVGGLKPGQFNLTLTPPSGLGSPITFAGSETTDASNTVEVLPGATYTVAEASVSSNTAYLNLGLQVSTDGGNTWTAVSGNQVTGTAGTDVLYRLVNESVPAIDLPLTGGLGTDVITYWSIGLLTAAAVLIGWQFYRRRGRPHRRH